MGPNPSPQPLAPLLPRKPWWPLLHKARHSLPEITPLQRDLHLPVGVDGRLRLPERTADDLHETLVAMQKMLRITSERLLATSAEAERTMVALQHLTARLDSTLANPALARTMTHLDSATATLNTMSAQFTTTGARLDTLLAGITHGKGTIGKFATDSGLYFGALGASNSLKALLDTLQKHPGKITVQVKIF